jgi:hypothetical protein
MRLTESDWTLKKCAMTNNEPGLSARLRHYATLATQVVPVIILVLNAASGNVLKSLVLLLPLLLATTGPILELTGRRLGRYLTLGGLGLQIAGLIVLFVMIYNTSIGPVKFQASDLWVILLFLIPVTLFLWNYLGGRNPVPVAVATA